MLFRSHFFSHLRLPPRLSHRSGAPLRPCCSTSPIHPPSSRATAPPNQHHTIQPPLRLRRHQLARSTLSPRLARPTRRASGSPRHLLLLSPSLRCSSPCLHFLCFSSLFSFSHVLLLLLFSDPLCCCSSSLAPLLILTCCSLLLLFQFPTYCYSSSSQNPNLLLLL